MHIAELTRLINQKLFFIGCNIVAKYIELERDRHHKGNYSCKKKTQEERHHPPLTLQCGVFLHCYHQTAVDTINKYRPAQTEEHGDTEIARAGAVGHKIPRGRGARAERRQCRDTDHCTYC